MFVSVAARASRDGEDDGCGHPLDIQRSIVATPTPKLILELRERHAVESATNSRINFGEGSGGEGLRED
jgi:hypothetical protein